jgi:hypothetical protein
MIYPGRRTGSPASRQHHVTADSSRGMDMNTLTRCALAQCIFLYAVVAHSAADPAAAIADCRAKYAEHPPEHIACLERELQALDAAREEVAQPGPGAEQLPTNGPRETVEPVTVEIENVTYGFEGMGLFRMTDGQVWKATESTPREQRLDRL